MSDVGLHIFSANASFHKGLETAWLNRGLMKSVEQWSLSSSLCFLRAIDCYGSSKTDSTSPRFRMYWTGAPDLIKTGLYRKESITFLARSLEVQSFCCVTRFHRLTEELKLVLGRYTPSTLTSTCHKILNHCSDEGVRNTRWYVLWCSRENSHIDNSSI